MGAEKIQGERVPSRGSLDDPSLMSYRQLNRETEFYRGRGGISAETRSRGFRPAFRHRLTREIFPSTYQDGTSAMCHLLGGIPDHYVVERDPLDGMVLAVVPEIESGFERNGRFYSRDEATQLRQAA